MIKAIDYFLDRTTMYRLVLYYLAGLVGLAFVLGLFKLGQNDPSALAFSLLLVGSVSFLGNWVFARTFNAPANTDSIWITALIVVLIMDPVMATDLAGVGALVFAAVWAVASKYIFAFGKKHIFNPAAFGVLLPGLLLDHPATWWVAGNGLMLPFVLVGGILIVRKLRRTDLVLAFIAATLATSLATAAPDAYLMTIRETLIHSPLFFFAFVMLTEPLTAPTGKALRIAFAVIVGFFSAPNVHFGSFYLTPEMALLIGNAFAFLVSPKHRYVLTLQRIERSAANCYDFIFSPDRRFAFEAGQYMDWTLGLKHADDRGNRRQLTIASAPTEEDVRIGVRFYREPSTFKQGLAALKPGDTIVASQLSGAFTLPRDTSRKLVFIAGGIGITPFRSMLQYMLDRGEKRPVIVLYGNGRFEDIAYGDVLERARTELGIPTTYAVAEGAEPGMYSGFIDEALIRREVPDFAERTFYLSGPRAMVLAFEKTLLGMGVHRRHIKTDFFPGFA